jgi:acyl dehydratase
MIASNAATRHDPNFCWEDVVIGQTLTSSSYLVSEEEIVDFARRYDPLPIHVDKAQAAASQFGSLTAAGSHVLAIRQRLVHEFPYCGGVIAAIGNDEVRFLAPLRAGQSCRLEVVFLEKRPSSKSGDRGVVVIEMTLAAEGRPVMKLRDIVLMRRRRLGTDSETIS